MPSTELEQKKLEQFREMLKTLPEFCEEFFTGISQRTSPATRLGYAQDLKVFFTYYVNNILPVPIPITSLTIGELDKIQPRHIDKFLEYISLYQSGEEVRSNNIASKKRKLSALSSMYRFFVKRRQIKSNVIDVIEQPKLRDKAIIYLEPNETANLLDAVETGQGKTGVALAFHKHFAKRDLAIFSLFLGTGIRVSELVGINIQDLDLDTLRVKIIRKGGAEEYVYFNEEVRAPLAAYLEERKDSDPKEALFISMKKTRMSVRAVEELIKKYSQLIGIPKKVTPHKLRGTFGTQLYRNTGDIRLVADVLGHKDINTTRKRYAAASEDAGRRAAQSIRLRK